MPSSVTIAAHADAHAWDRFVRSHRDASFYHLYSWRDVFERAFRHRTEYLSATCDGQIAGVLPLVILDSWMGGRYAVSLPFVNYGGVLAADARVAGALLAHATAMAARDRWTHVEMRHRDRMFAGLPVKQHKVAMTLALPQSAALAWDGLDRKVRNQVRKAQKSGLTAELGGGELLDGFYDVFSRNMRDLGTPVYPKSFFSETLRCFPAAARVCIVRRGTQPVAAALVTAFRDVVEVPSAGSLREWRSLCPNHLLYWTLIENAIESGKRVFDFGRSTPGEGTFLFKQQWGAGPTPLSWEYQLLSQRALPDRSPRNAKFAPAIAVWKRLPVGVTRIVGPHLVRSLP
ncbi:MAG TPA: FemAB family XrtA/PEP-CTERM system-associated protein [Vicinamibacterales bacterium]